MAEELLINKSAPDEGIYIQLLPQISELINEQEPVISSLANVCAALKQSFDKVSWVGFYLTSGDRLFIGPFQGNTACSVIQFGRGVCGTSAKLKETVIVEDVDKFPGHIACDSGSKSEIVIPLINNDCVAGVLDLDSYNYSAFNETDKKYLEEIIKILISKLDFSKFHIM